MITPPASRTNAPLTTSAAVASPPESQASEPTPLAALDADVAQAIEASRSRHTRRALASRWRVFTDWAQAHGVQVLPAAPEDVARYVTALAQRGASVATIRAYASAIATRHRDADLDNPCAHQGVRLAIKGLSRAHAQLQRQATPLDAAALEAIRETACIPRAGRGGVLETEAAAQARGLVDIALCTLMSDAGLRRSEAAVLTWGDVERWSDGSGRVTVRRSKTDQTAAGAVVGVTRTTMRALDAIRPGEVDDEKAVFGLSGAQISRRIARAARQAGLQGDFTGHSGRVGLAVRMAQNAAPTDATMRQGRWASASMVTRYTRQVSAGEALHWLK